jgi:hypothetical protein
MVHKFINCLTELAKKIGIFQARKVVGQLVRPSSCCPLAWPAVNLHISNYSSRLGARPITIHNLQISTKCCGNIYNNNFRRAHRRTASILVVQIPQEYYAIILLP